MIEWIINDSEDEPAISFDVEVFLSKVAIELMMAEGVIEISFISPEMMIAVNQAHLGKDYVTDIITYNLADAGQPVEADIYICLKQVRDNAQEWGHAFEFELKIVLIHGLLHLLGHVDYTDADRAEMDRLQLEILGKVAAR
jgi:probable rRNA maturation factor